MCALACAMAASGPSIQLSEYAERRAKLRQVAGDATVILVGRTERDGDHRSGFFQEPNFYYLTGWNEPGAILVLTPKSEVLLIPRRDPVAEHWTGAKAAPGDSNIEAATGFTTVVESEKFESRLPAWIEEGRRVLTLTAEPYAETLRKLMPMRTIENAGPQIARMRMKKSDAELAVIQRATDAAIAAHRAAWKRVRPGLFEYQIAATLSNAYFDAGCARHAYAPIIGSGKNGAILHYSANSRRMDGGELLLMDAGPECSMYASDITRTVPVAGKFTDRQRELYNIVLGAQKAALEAIKPGVMLGSRFNKVGVQKLVTEYFDKHGGLGKYFTHGLGHHVGLDVHDAHDPAMPLEAGMVITLEPGLYIPEEGIGIRIEDVVLVTETGARLLSGKLPREAAEVEREMAAR